MSSVFITGRIAGAGARTIDVPAAVWEVYSSAGYGEPWEPSSCQLEIGRALCTEPLLAGEAEYRGVSDDQSVITGYAIDSPETNCAPPEHWLASRLGRRLQQIRIERPDLRLGPDRKVAVNMRAGGPVSGNDQRVPAAGDRERRDRTQPRRSERCRKRTPDARLVDRDRDLCEWSG